MGGAGLSRAAEQPDTTTLSPSAIRGLGPTLFVWGGWLLMLVVALGFVHRYAVRAPTSDDLFLLVPPLTGHQPITLPFLLTPVNEHRLPLVTAILLGAGWLTKGSFHVENYLNVLVLAGLAAALILTARHVRGSLSFSDAFFPIALLHLGHFDAFVGPRINLNHVLSTGLIGLALAMLVWDRGPLTAGRAWTMGGVLLCLPLSAANGLPFVLVSVLWFVYAAWLARGQGGTGLSLLGPAAMLALLVGLYGFGYTRPAHHPAPPSLMDVGRAAARASVSGT